MPAVVRRVAFALLVLAVESSATLANPGPFVPGTPQTISTRTAPRSVAVGDINKDGIPDLMVSSSGGFSFHKGLGGGTFAARVDYGVSGPCGNAVLADFNMDGNLDVAAPARVSALPGPVVLAGAGDGTFGPVNVASGPANEDFLVVADFNDDGKPDMATCGYATSAGTCSVYLNTTSTVGGVPQFSRTDYPVGTKPAGIAAGYLKSSPPYKDLVIANYGAGTVTILKNDGTGHFGTREDLTAKPSVYAVTVADFNGGYLPQEIVTANKDSSSVSYMIGDGGGAWYRWEYPVAGKPSDVTVADAVGDGQLEILATCPAANKVSILARDPQGFAQTLFLPENDIPTGTTPASVAVVNLNGDIKNDLLAVNQGAASLTYTPGLIQSGWKFGDFLPGDFTAQNQFGDDTHFSGLSAGKWVLLDICSNWCTPCRAMAQHTEDMYVRWAGNPNLQFEYVTGLEDGQVAGIPSTQFDAMAWSNTYHINRPILHSGGSLLGGIRALAAQSQLTATPTLRLINPQGQIVWYNEGAADESTLTRVLANAAGVPIPPPVSSAPPGLANGQLAVIHGSDSVIANYLTGQPPAAGDFEFFDYGLGDNLLAWWGMGRDAAGLESWTLTASYTSWGRSGAPYGALPTDNAWSFSMSNMAIDPGTYQPRNGSVASVTIVDTLGVEQTVPYLVPYTWDNANWNLVLDPIPASVLAAMPPIRTITLSLMMQVGQIVTGVPGGPGAGATQVSLRAPWPNPSRETTQFAWTQPRAGVARLELYDVRGRLVKTLVNGAQTAGEHDARWDLTDEHGARVGAGLYFARVAVAGRDAATTRVTVLR